MIAGETTSRRHVSFPVVRMALIQWMVLQVCRLLKAAHCPSLLCLQGLWEIAIYIEGIFEESEPVHFLTGDATGLLDSSTNTEPVLDAIGQLASSGIFPALKKVTPGCTCLSSWCARSVRVPLYNSVA